jgi:hypothetical protein
VVVGYHMMVLLMLWQHWQLLMTGLLCSANECHAAWEEMLAQLLVSPRLSAPLLLTKGSSLKAPSRVSMQVGSSQRACCICGAEASAMMHA